MFYEKIIVTSDEESFYYILNKICGFSNNYKLFISKKLETSNGLSNRDSFIKLSFKDIDIDTGTIKSKINLKINKSFVLATSYLGKEVDESEYPILITLSLYPDEILNIKHGDIIVFFPFGFKVIQKGFSNIFRKYTDITTFFRNPFGKKIDFFKEQEKRLKQMDIDTKNTYFPENYTATIIFEEED